jgi:hypothetical protein
MSYSFNTNTPNPSGASMLASSKSPLVKFVLLLAVMVAFVVLLRVGMYIVTKFMAPSSSPHIFDGMVDAKNMLVYPQDPNDSDAVTIYRSVDESDGIEFTWSSWIYINNLQYGKGQYKNVFYKGDSNSRTGNNLSNLINSPGLYIAPNINTLIVTINTFAVMNQEIFIPNIPLNKWLSVIIRCRNTTLDVYINGVITRSIELSGVPRQNYGDVYVAANGGFDGYVSDLWYHNHALGALDINSIVDSGPNTTLLGSSQGINEKDADYLSLRWFFGA